MNKLHGTFKNKTHSSIYSVPLIIGILHPQIISKTVTKGTVREQSAMEGGEARMTLDSVKRQSHLDVRTTLSWCFEKSARQMQTTAG